MRVQTAATLLATATLVAGVGLGAVVTAPAVTAAVQQQSPPRSEAVESSRPSAAVPRLSPSDEVSAPTSSRSYTGPLIGAIGSVPVTREQLHAWAQSRPFAGQDPRNDAIWEEQQWLDIQCMARKGFLEDPTNPQLARHEAGEQDGLTAAQAKAYSAALYGPPSDAPYDWRTAGCHGRSVHLTGQDNAH